jgi:bifunctional non-homologous end joining protein LigD
MPASDTLLVDRRKVTVSNLDKRLYPSGFTKREVIDYYLRVAPAILPHLKDRAVTLKRYPNGSDAPFFFEKNCPAHRPDWVRTQHVPGRSSEGVNYCMLNSRAALLWAVNLAALELHVPLAKGSKPGQALVMVFDFDPGPPATMKECSAMALQLREMFSDLKLQSFAKTSGNKGLHVYVPLNTPAMFEQTKDFARAVAGIFERRHPNQITSNMSKSLRPGRIFIDWSQNDSFKTTVCAYSLRAGTSPGVSTPVRWEEVEAWAQARRTKAGIRLNPGDVLDRLQRWGDLFEPVLKLRQRLPEFD